MSEELVLAGRHYKHRRDGFAILSIDMTGRLNRVVYVADTRDAANEEARRFVAVAHENLIVLPICATYFRADAADLPLE